MGGTDTSKVSGCRLFMVGQWHRKWRITLMKRFILSSMSESISPGSKRQSSPAWVTKELLCRPVRANIGCRDPKRLHLIWLSKRSAVPTGWSNVCSSLIVGTWRRCLRGLCYPYWKRMDNKWHQMKAQIKPTIRKKTHTRYCLTPKKKIIPNSISEVYSQADADELKPLIELT